MRPTWGTETVAHWRPSQRSASPTIRPLLSANPTARQPELDQHETSAKAPDRGVVGWEFVQRAPFHVSAMGVASGLLG